MLKNIILLWIFLPLFLLVAGCTFGVIYNNGIRKFFKQILNLKQIEEKVSDNTKESNENISKLKQNLECSKQEQLAIAKKHIIEVNDLIEENRSAKKQILGLKEQLNLMNLAIVETPTAEVMQLAENPEPEIPPPSLSQSIYFITPNNNGFFPLNVQSSVKTSGLHNYHFEIDKNNINQAYVTEVFSDNIKAILEAPHIYIKPLFIESNDPSPLTKKIIVLENKNGLWFLNGSQWEMKTKATIKYE